MVRFAIIGVVVGVALILYALVDAAMSDASRARGVSKPVWVVLIVVLPVIGAVLWFMIGKGRGPAPVAVRPPDDDPRFAGKRMSSQEIDSHVEELEARLRELDNEVFPGVDEHQSGRATSTEQSATNGTDLKGVNPRSFNANGTEPRSTEPRAGEAKPAGPRSADPNVASTKPDGDAAGEQR